MAALGTRMLNRLNFFSSFCYYHAEEGVTLGKADRGRDLDLTKESVEIIPPDLLKTQFWYQFLNA